VESELFAGLFRRAGWSLVTSPAAADLLLLNTCAFIGPAVEESLEAVAAAERWKRHRKGRILVLAGCLPGRFPDDGSGGLEAFDLILMPGDFEGLARFLGLPDSGTVQARAVSSASRFLRIADGCSNCCAYCTIPMIRGPFRSDPLPLVQCRAAALVSDGAREIGLVAQDSGSWRDGGRDVCDLVEYLAGRHPSVLWRLYYLHPAHFPRRLLDLFSSARNIAPWIDLPVQHASNRVLEHMGRPYRRSDLEEIARWLDSSAIRVALRATVIVGYPGETDDDFEQLRSCLGSLRSLRSLVVFPYHEEEETRQAGTGTALVPDEVIAERIALLGLVGDAAAASWAEDLAGKEIDVVSDTSMLGHSVYDAPDIEGVCTFASAVSPGELVRCRVLDAWGLDMRVAPLERGN
jgi:ribosomal protein S12 methylthiotransferase